MNEESTEQRAPEPAGAPEQQAAAPEQQSAPGSGAEAVPSPATRPNWPNGDAEWQRVSPKYAVADLTLNLLFDAVVLAALVVVLVVMDQQPPLLVVIGLIALFVVLLINSLLAFRRVRAIGYILREDDLLFRRGIMFERVIAVPYGRLQLVDVNRGPLLRALGLATLKFVTASAATGVQLPGLRVEDAEQLRDRLIELAETRRSGL